MLLINSTIIKLNHSAVWIQEYWVCQLASKPRYLYIYATSQNYYLMFRQWLFAFYSWQLIVVKDICLEGTTIFWESKSNSNTFYRGMPLEFSGTLSYFFPKLFICTILTIRFSEGDTAWKVSKYGVISGPYFPVFGLNTDHKQLCIWTLFTQWDILCKFEDRAFTGTLQNNCFVEKFQKVQEKYLW